MKRLVASFTTGSYATGLVTPNSDKDSLEVYVEDATFYFGLGRNTAKGQTKAGGEDVLVYEMTDYAAQLWKGNVSFWQTLWQKPDFATSEFFKFHDVANYLLTTKTPVRTMLGLANRRYEQGCGHLNKGNYTQGYKDLSASYNQYMCAAWFCKYEVYPVDVREQTWFEIALLIKTGGLQAGFAKEVVESAERCATAEFQATKLREHADYDTFNAALVNMVKNSL